MKTIVISILLVFSLNSWGALAGNWTGFGTWKFRDEGDGVRCLPMTMSWAEDEKTLDLRQGFFDCELVAMDLGSSSWTKQGNLLFDESGAQIGTYDGTDLNVIIAGPHATTKINVVIRREANHIDYKEYWFNAEEKVYSIVGRLFTSGQ